MIATIGTEKKFCWAIYTTSLADLFSYDYQFPLDRHDRHAWEDLDQT